MNTDASTPKSPASQTPLTFPSVSLKAGLYLVATPIGNLGDITLRALSVLHAAAVVACEDTRVSAKLLRHYGIATRLEAYHEHNAERKRPELLARIAQGSTVALISDAGTPLISDPGYKLVREAAAQGLHVEALPGPSSVMAALCVAALPTDRFLFIGFLPNKEAALRTALTEIAQTRATLVCFESAKRLADSLSVLHAVLGPRDAAVTRELTKLYEEVRRGTLQELAEHYAQADEPRGEIVLVIGPPQHHAPDPQTLDALLVELLGSLSVKDAVAEACRVLDMPHKQVYKRALELKP